jgi:lipopolysaccharide/colanic/teichoic acid biosynthesis glycosyltransferase
MRLIVIREEQSDATGVGTSLLRRILSMAPLTGVVQRGLEGLWCCQQEAGLVKEVGWMRGEGSTWVIPQGWQTDLAADFDRTVFYHDSVDIDLPERDVRHSRWVVIANARFVTPVNGRLLERLLGDTSADVISITASSDLLAYQEKIRLTPDNELVGYRRLYADSIAPMPMPSDWPPCLFVKREMLRIVLEAGLLSRFGAVVETCRAQGLSVCGFAVAGTVFDLESDEGVLALCRVALSQSSHGGPDWRAARGRGAPIDAGNGNISAQSRLIGPVLLGERVSIEPEAVIVGPSVLCNDSRVLRGAVIDSSIVGTQASVEPKQVLRSRVVLTPPHRTKIRLMAAHAGEPQREQACLPRRDIFRTWPRLSYAGCFKRMADVVVAAVVLLLFAPVIPLIALAVRITSPGPVFFRDRRQGFHGKPFRCIKFRTMKMGSDKIQDKLRFVSEVDGPQFKMADDPRITAVGHFLRETYLDEIPQFFNVLCGQMSVVGPRPSPESENTLCPSWRDARLSVRPGITGLWQVCRTREPLKDFQEWIHYDTQYVRELSPRLDLWICWRTFRRMLSSFANQF